MSEKDALLILAFLVASLASWVIYLLFRVQELQLLSGGFRRAFERQVDKVINLENELTELREELNNDR